MYSQVLLAGFFGGIIRGIVGFVKHFYSYKNVKFKLSKFLGMSFLSGIIGLMAAAAVKELGFNFKGFFTPALSFIVGYAGGDFIENIYKIILKKSSLYEE